MTRAFQQSLSSSSALLNQPFSNAEAFTARDVADAAQRGNLAAAQAYETLGTYLGIGLSSLINILDLPLIVVGGGVAEAWDLFAPAMFAAVHRYSVIYRLVQPSQHLVLEPDRTMIVRASLGPSAGLIGAALLSRLPKRG